MTSVSTCRVQTRSFIPDGVDGCFVGRGAHGKGARRRLLVRGGMAGARNPPGTLSGVVSADARGFGRVRGGCGSADDSGVRRRCGTDGPPPRRAPGCSRRRSTAGPGTGRPASGRVAAAFAWASARAGANRRSAAMSWDHLAGVAPGEEQVTDAVRSLWPAMRMVHSRPRPRPLRPRSPPNRSVDRGRLGRQSEIRSGGHSLWR